MPRFCPRCHGLMKPVKEVDGEVYMVCIRCGYKMKASSNDLRTYRVSTKITHTEKDKTIVISEENVNLPITKDVICPRCGYGEAYYWMIQTRAADEPPTRFYKCRRCGYVWREYE
ncbi:MAG: transcription factor S [Desulfurococcales archaeon ex4484_58]|nr:MAG: transcription factor S [Desulfurococcales archaeon ex4484_58]